MNHPQPVLGFRRDGRPIRLVAGAAPDHVELLSRAVDGMTGGAPGESPLTIVQRNYDLVMEARGHFLDSVISQKRGMHASEQRLWDKSNVERAELEARLNELHDAEKREAASAGARALTGGGVQTGMMGGYTSSQTYHRGNDSASFFRDLINAPRGDADAADRLRRNNAEVGLESRALGNTGAVGGSGGEFAPPGYLVEDYVRLARPGRVMADLFVKDDLPRGVSTINVPKVATGTTVSSQTTQLTALSQTDLTSNSLTSGIATIGGKQVISQQLLDQSAIPFDKVVMQDLAGAHAANLGQQVITGLGTGGVLRGYLTPPSTSVTTWTQAAPTAAGFYGQLAKTQQQIQTTRFVPPDAVIMHPRRWAWLASFTDSTGRPLVVPSAGGFNAMADPANANASGYVGTVLGMMVHTDPNIPTNLGAGLNQDVVLMTVKTDLMLWESPIQAEAFREPYSDAMGVLVRIYSYAAAVVDRYLASLGQIQGTGLTPPVFAS